MYKLTVGLTKREIDALRAAARREMRGVDVQARYLLRLALLGESPPDPQAAPMTNGAGVTLASEPGAVSAAS